jgi:von Willebrand factor type A domain
VQLFEEKKPIPIQFFAHEPASIGILADTSGSMESKLPQAKEAITQFVNDLNPQDDVFLFAFSSQPFLLQPFTTDHKAVVARTSLFYCKVRLHFTTRSSTVC